MKKMIMLVSFILMFISCLTLNTDLNAMWTKVDDSSSNFECGGGGWVRGEPWINSYEENHSYTMADNYRWANWYCWNNTGFGANSIQNVQVYLWHPNFKASVSYYIMFVALDGSTAVYPVAENISQNDMSPGFSYIGPNYDPYLTYLPPIRVHAKTWYGGNNGKLFGADAVAFGTLR